MQLQDLIVLKIDFEYVYKIYGTNNPKILHFYAINLCDNYKLQFDINIDYITCYSMCEIIFFRKPDMKGIFFIEIPYAHRTQYINAILEINSLVNEDGMVFLAVNNNPYILESYLVVETDSYEKKIESVVQTYHLRNSQNKGIKEILMEMGSKRWNIVSISKRSGKEELTSYMKACYCFKEKDKLTDQGYLKQFNKKKVFISYSHRDEDVVMNIYNEMQITGINCWINLYDINVGEVIAKKMLDGIKEYDFGIFFLSKNYLQSLMAKAELQNFLVSIFKEQKKWYLVKLDDVNVDDIQSGLGNYKYYDFSENSEIEKLVMDMGKVLGGNRSTRL